MEYSQFFSCQHAQRTAAEEQADRLAGTSKEFYNWNGLSWDEPMAPKDDTIYNFRNCDATGDTKRTNILYRWDGENLTEISESLALGEVTGTAYEGSKGHDNRTAIISTPAQLVSTLNISTDASKVNLTLETATKSGLNYSPATESVRSIPAATSTTAGIITSAQYTSLTETIPNKLIEIEETLEGKQDSGDYALSSEIPTKVSELTNDSGFITNSALTDYALKSELPDLSNYALKSEIPSLDGYATQSWVSSQGYLTSVPNTYALKTDIPTNISELTNDTGFITNSALSTYALKSEIPDTSNFATKTEVAAKQDALVSGTNIKTINGTSLLGEGNIVIEGGGGSSEITDVLDNKIYGRTQGTWVDLTDYLTWGEYD